MAKSTFRSCLEDENGVAHGNDWARGFMRGMHMRHDGWAELVNDEENGGCLIPMMMLYHEHDEDPEMRPKPITPEKREDIIVHMAAGLVGAYRYFREHQEASRAVHLRLSLDARPPRSGGTTHVPAVRGRNTRSAAAGRL